MKAAIENITLLPSVSAASLCRKDGPGVKLSDSLARYTVRCFGHVVARNKLFRPNFRFWVSLRLHPR